MLNTQLVKFNLADYASFYSAEFIPLPVAYQQYDRVKVLECVYNDNELGLISEEVYVCLDTAENSRDNYSFKHLYDAVNYSYGTDLTATDFEYF